MAGVEVRGTVGRSAFAAGSKSEREAIYLDTDAGERYLLRLAGGNAFHDPALEPFVGQRVVCHGSIIGYTLLADSIEPAP